MKTFVTIKVPLDFVTRPANQSVIESQMAQFECTVNKPLATIFWTFTQQGTNTSTPLSDQEEEFSISTSSSSSTLTVLVTVFSEHVGLYTCVVMNGNQSISSSASLDIQS